MKRLWSLYVMLGTSSVLWGQVSQHNRGDSGNRQDTLSLTSATHVLKEVVVRASSVERKVDRYVLRVLPAVNKDGLELLSQAPGVFISADGIGINGAGGTKVFVDDREIKLSGEMLMNYLRSLKSEDVARIEVLPMSGADKDASLQGGAIYLIMRRRLDQGMQGSASVQSALTKSFQRYQPMGSFNLHRGKYDWYASGSATFIPENDGRSEAVRQYQTDKRFSSSTLMKQPSHCATFKTGGVWAMDTLRRLGIEMEYLRNANHPDSESQSLLSENHVDFNSHGTYFQRETYDQYSLTVNYVHRLDSRGSVLKAVGDYTLKHLNANNRYYISQEVGQTISDTIYRSHSSAAYQIATGDVSWKQYLWQKATLQAGLKYTHTCMNDDSYYEGYNQKQEWVRNDAYGYTLNYNEHIGAAYLTYALEWKRWSVNMGGRGEYTQTNDQTNQCRRTYWDWFPHLDMTYAFDPVRKWMIIGQYARYIERPAFKALNPNRIQTSDYSYLIGNPALRPTYINRFSATIVYQHRYTLTIGGNLHRDLIREFAKQDANQPEVSYITYENHYRENHWFVAASLPWQPFTWLNFTSNVVGVKQSIQMYKASDFATHYLYFLTGNLSLLLPSDYVLEWGYNGVSRLYSGNSEIAPRHTLNVSLRTKWQSGRWSARLGVDNLFNRNQSYVSRLENYTVHSSYQSASDGRIFKLALTWSFNHGKPIKKVTVESQSSSEKNRLNGN